jgi:hypothetical protein
LVSWIFVKCSDVWLQCPLLRDERGGNWEKASYGSACSGVSPDYTFRFDQNIRGWWMSERGVMQMDLTAGDGEE